MPEPTNQQEASERAFGMVHGADPRDFRMIDANTVAEILGVNVCTVWRKAARGQLPKPLRIAGLTRWRLADIEGVIKAAERDSKAPEAA